MSKRFLLSTLLIIAFAVTTRSAVFETGVYRMDTTVYEYPPFYNLILVGPEDLHTHNAFNQSAQAYQVELQVWIYHKKQTDQYDIVSFSGKTGSFIIPDAYLDLVSYNSRVVVSRTFIDGDDGWECIVNNYDDSGKAAFTVHDDEGTLIISDSGTASYGFDGKNTYIIRRLPIANDFKYWRCRTLTSPISSPALAKSAASGPLPMMTFGATGGYRISLQPAGGGKTTVQLFDLLGKLIFAKTIDQITRPTTFTIPESGVPRTPFIAKVRDGNGSVVRRQVPVR